MTSQLIFKPEDILPSNIHIKDDRGNDIREYHSLILSSYYGYSPDKYTHSVEEFLCYYFGYILSKIEITNFDAVRSKLSFDKKDLKGVSDWDIEFLYSIILKHILCGKNITTRQFKCLKKMRFKLPDSKYKVDMIEENLKSSLRETKVKKNEIKFLMNNTIGIRYDYNEHLIFLILELFNSNATYNSKLEMNIVNLDTVSKFQLDVLKKNGFEIDKIIYDLIELRGTNFFEVNEDGDNITILDNNGFTTSLLKTLVITGNIK